MNKKLTPRLQQVYDKAIKLKEADPSRSMASILTQIGSSASTFWRAKHLITKGEGISAIPQKYKKRIVQVKAVPKEEVLSSVITPSRNKPLIALAGTPEDVTNSLIELLFR